jgi:hypothetical protein
VDFELAFEDNTGLKRRPIVVAWIAARLIVAGALGAGGPDAAGVEDARRQWAFQPPRAQALPAVERRDWPRGRIDRFILARLERAGLEPAPAADPRTLYRRAAFDLTGLPPASDGMAAIEDGASASPSRAYEDLVERLLASPAFGERWARVWLDLARYAEDQAHIVGSDKSLFYPNAHLYRDWVIGALNTDLPYDRFVELQLAADLIGDDGKEHLAALGFLGLGPKYYGRGSQAVIADEWEDRVDVVGRGLLGLTLACARCHDHKYDPISTEDYYALAGVFASTEMFNWPLDEKRELKKDGQAKNPEDSMHVVREGEAKDLNVFIRGSVDDKGPIVPRRFLRALCDGEPRPFVEGSGRRELARAIAGRDNPLAARVIVNRVWGQCFGRPLVGSASNFGALGEDPTHAELLDDLAARFMDTGWSLKRLVREIALSAAYRQSSRARPQDLAADPENRLVGRMPRRRLSVEAWRDSLLAAAGRLDTAVGGPSMDPSKPGETRRTVYSAVSRLELNRMLALFDFPDPNVHAERRVETTTPLQKLFVLNGDWLWEQAAAFAARVEAEAPPREAVAAASGGGAELDERGQASRIERAYEILFARRPSSDELRLGLAFLGEGGAGGDRERWQSYAHALLASNEMLFID